MAGEATWGVNASSLDDSQKELLSGGGLSTRFAKLPLWLSHPSNIGAFYGLLVSLALILPYITTEEFWFPLWIFHSSLLIAATAFLGMTSRIMNIIFKRMPVSVNRKLLYPLPFLGFTLVTLISTGLLTNTATVSFISWSLLMAPGPLYIHLSWAPRWRLLCMIEDGINPFEPMESKDYDRSQEVAEVAGDDSELMEVVESFEAEE